MKSLSESAMLFNTYKLPIPNTKQCQVFPEHDFFQLPANQCLDIYITNYIHYLLPKEPPSWWTDQHTQLLVSKMNQLEQEAIEAHQNKMQDGYETRQQQLHFCLQHIKLFPEVFLSWAKASLPRLHSVLSVEEIGKLIQDNLKGKQYGEQRYQIIRELFPDGKMPIGTSILREIYPCPMKEFDEMYEMTRMMGWPDPWIQFDSFVLFVALLCAKEEPWAWEIIKQRLEDPTDGIAFLKAYFGFIPVLATKQPQVQQWLEEILSKDTPTGRELASQCIMMKFTSDKDVHLPDAIITKAKQCLAPSEYLSKVFLIAATKISNKEIIQPQEIEQELKELEDILQRHTFSIFDHPGLFVPAPTLGIDMERGFVLELLNACLSYFGTLAFTAQDENKNFPFLIRTALQLWIIGTNHVLARAAEQLYQFLLITASRTVGGEEHRREPLAVMMTTVLTDLLRVSDEKWQYIEPLSVEDRMFLFLALGELGTSKAERFLHHAKKHANHARQIELVRMADRVLEYIRQKRYEPSPKERLDRVGALLRVLNRKRSKKEVKVRDKRFVQDIKESYGINE